jgi:uncharacterized membrane protein YfcA
VLALDTAMGLSMNVSTTTSTIMIGVTAAASAGIYFWRSEIALLVAAPVALGVLIGALVGARMLARISNRLLRLLCLARLGSAPLKWCSMDEGSCMRGMRQQDEASETSQLTSLI